MTAVRRARTINPARLDEATLISKPVCCCEMLPRGVAGLMTINSAVYRLEYNADLPDQGEPVVHGWRITSAAGQVYDLDAALLTCSCPDWIFRRGTPDFPFCKHLLAFRKLREAGDL